jgi:hypothetical protein
MRARGRVRCTHRFLVSIFPAVISRAYTALGFGKARWRARLHIHESRLSGLLADASELLDELDEVLVCCHPLRDAEPFAGAAPRSRYA